MSAQEYLATETTKSIGTCLELLDQIGESLRGADTAKLEGLPPDVLARFHKSVAGMKETLGAGALLGVFLNAACSIDGDAWTEDDDS